MGANRIFGQLFNGVLKITSRFARNANYNGLTRAIMRALGGITLMMRRGSSKASLAEIGQEWQRMFPSKKFVPITNIDEKTVYAEITVKCPLRASGDLNACYRMMEYDRKMLEKIGGQLIVLRSQAEAGVERCQIAIRKKDDDANDLIHAHKKAK
jgi:hypothetical protein